MDQTELQAVFRGRFFTALDVAETTLGIPRSLESLSSEVSSYVPVTIAQRVTQWDASREATWGETRETLKCRVTRLA